MQRSSFPCDWVFDPKAQAMEGQLQASVLPEHSDLQAGATHAFILIFLFLFVACLLIAFKQANTSATLAKKATKMLFLR